MLCLKEIPAVINCMVASLAFGPALRVISHSALGREWGLCTGRAGFKASRDRWGICDKTPPCLDCQRFAQLDTIKYVYFLCNLEWFHFVCKVNPKIELVIPAPSLPDTILSKHQRILEYEAA